jgi:hypothetical protein
MYNLKVILKIKMKLKIIITFLFLCIQSTHCLSQNNTYPLNIGDKWIYLQTDFNSGNFYGEVEKDVLEDTIFENGKVYKKIKEQGNYIDNIIYQRIQGDSIYQFINRLNREELFFDFTRSQRGEIINCFSNNFNNPNDTTYIYLWSIGNKYLWGKNRRQWIFLVDYSKFMVDDERHIEITEGIGITNKQHGP